MALVNTGATVSVMRNAFKDRLGREVLFKWDKGTSFRGVIWEPLHPLGVCTVNVSTGGRAFKSEFAILAKSTQDVILGNVVLRDCGAPVDFATGELSVSSLRLFALDDEPHTNKNIDTFRVSEDRVLPAWSLAIVRVSDINGTVIFDALVEPLPRTVPRRTVWCPIVLYLLNEDVLVHSELLFTERGVTAGHEAGRVRDKLPHFSRCFPS